MATLAIPTPEKTTTAQGQVNVRMSRQLKEAGDTALAEVGLSPSDAVRALWKALSSRGATRERVLDALDVAQRESARSEKRLERIELVERMARRYAQLGAGDANPAALPVLDEDAWDELAWADYQDQLAGGESL